MSSFEYCPRGGQEGIATTIEEQVDLAAYLGHDNIDAFVPIPNMQPEEQIIKIDMQHDHEDVINYWENDKGSHGWCCSQCGKIVQWG